MIDIPLMVNGCFSIELSIKALLINNNIGYEREHNLYLLFFKLPKSLQSEILGHLCEKAPEYSDAEKLADELVLISNIFVDWRYAFEGKMAPAIDLRFISAFANASIWTLLAHYNVEVSKQEKDCKSYEEINLMFEENRKMCISNNIEIIRRKLT